MMRNRMLAALVLGLAAILILNTSCSLMRQQPPITYDPNKTYASFLVIDSDPGRTSLETMKRHTVAEGMEIGPIEYYSSGTTDFLPYLTRLTANPQIKVVWIVSNVLDVPNIKVAMSTIKYTGQYRYAPIVNGVGAIINQ